MTVTSTTVTSTTVTATPRQLLTRWKILIIFVIIIVFMTVALGLLTPQRSSNIPLATDNPSPNGTRALAEVLRDQGVEVSEVTDPREAINQAKNPDTTLVIVEPGLNAPDVREKLLTTGARTVILGTFRLNEPIFDGVTSSGYSSETSLLADCPVSAAATANNISKSRGSLTLPTDSNWTGCFPIGDNFAYASTKIADREVAIISDPTLATNAVIAQEGNSALLLRTIGYTSRVVWYRASPMHSLAEEIASFGKTPKQLPTVLLTLAVTALCAAFWQGRRFGRLVVEALPVVVPAIETVKGRGNLYRHSRDRAHVAAALRAGSSLRLAKKLGVPLNGSREHLTEVIAKATNKPVPYVISVLYGPVPTNDAALSRLATALDKLESEATHDS